MTTAEKVEAFKTLLENLSYDDNATDAFLAVVSDAFSNENYSALSGENILYRVNRALRQSQRGRRVREYVREYSTFYALLRHVLNSLYSRNHAQTFRFIDLLSDLAGPLNFPNTNSWNVYLTSARMRLGEPEESESTDEEEEEVEGQGTATLQGLSYQQRLQLQEQERANAAAAAAAEQAASMSRQQQMERHRQALANAAAAAAAAAAVSQPSSPYPECNLCYEPLDNDNGPGTSNNCSANCNDVVIACANNHMFHRGCILNSCNALPVDTLYAMHRTQASQEGTTFYTRQAITTICPLCRAPLLPNCEGMRTKQRVSTDDIMRMLAGGRAKRRRSKSQRKSKMKRARSLRGGRSKSKKSKKSYKKKRGKSKKVAKSRKGSRSKRRSVRFQAQRGSSRRRK